MKHYDLIVIGGDGAGMGAASQARRINPDMSIAVYEKGNFVSYAGCGIPYYISDIVHEFSSLLAIDREKFSRTRNIDVNINSEVTSVDFGRKIISVTHNTISEEIIYDKLIIATGAHPFIPPIDGIDSRNIFLLRNLQHGIDLKNKIVNGSAKSVILIGGGFINLELAEAFRTKGLDVTLIEKLESVAPMSSPEIQQEIQEELKKNGINLFQNTDILGFSDENNCISVATDKGEFKADFAVLSTGVRPSTEFLRNSELKMSYNGAIIVNEKSETNIQDVYAAGDCATVKNLLTGKDEYIPMATTANKQGRVAGLQSAGVRNESFPGSIGSQVFKVFDLEVAKTGFNLKDAEKNGLSAVEKVTRWHSRAGYYPESAEITVKLTVLKDSGAVIGGEICGRDYAGIRINTVAAAVTAGMNIKDLAYLDAAYAPPFSPVWDPILAAAQNFMKREPGQQ